MQIHLHAGLRNADLPTAHRGLRGLERHVILARRAGDRPRVFQQQLDLLRLLAFLFDQQAMIFVGAAQQPGRFVLDRRADHGRIGQPQRHFMPSFAQQVDLQVGRDLHDILAHHGLVLDLRNHRAHRRCERRRPDGSCPGPPSTVPRTSRKAGTRRGHASRKPRGASRKGCRSPAPEATGRPWRRHPSWNHRPWQNQRRQRERASQQGPPEREPAWPLRQADSGCLAPELDPLRPVPPGQASHSRPCCPQRPGPPAAPVWRRTCRSVYRPASRLGLCRRPRWPAQRRIDKDRRNGESTEQRTKNERHGSSSRGMTGTACHTDFQGRRAAAELQNGLRSGGWFGKLLQAYTILPLSFDEWAAGEVPPCRFAGKKRVACRGRCGQRHNCLLLNVFRRQKPCLSRPPGPQRCGPKSRPLTSFAV